MPSLEPTGEIVPGWIREKILRLERAWPCWTLAGGAGVTILLQSILGVTLWLAGPVFYYARP